MSRDENQRRVARVHLRMALGSLEGCKNTLDSVHHSALTCGVPLGATKDLTHAYHALQGEVQRMKTAMEATDG